MGAQWVRQRTVIRRGQGENGGRDILGQEWNFGFYSEAVESQSLEGFEQKDNNQILSFNKIVWILS